MKVFYTLMLFLHIVAVVIWVGGLFLLLASLRPTVDVAAGAQHNASTVALLERFFSWAAIAIIVILASGLSMIVGGGGFRNAHTSVHLMFGIGLVMMALHLHARFALFKRLRAAVRSGDAATAALQLGQLRQWMTVTCILGVATIAVATIGRALL